MVVLFFLGIWLLFSFVTSFITFWAIGVLFGVDIPWNLSTWFAYTVLMIVLKIKLEVKNG